VIAPREHCWRHVGIDGDRSCPELAAVVHCRNCPVLAAAARDFFDRPAPPGYLESWQEMLAAPESPPDTDFSNVLVFRLGDDWLAFSAVALVEVIPSRRPQRIPHRRAAVLAGIVNVRGQLHLCVRLEGLLGLAARPAEAVAAPTARMIVVERRQERWVIPVDEVGGLHPVSAKALRDPPATVTRSDTRATTALFTWQDRPVGLIDEARLLDGLRDRITG